MFADGERRLSEITGGVYERVLTDAPKRQLTCGYFPFDDSRNILSGPTLSHFVPGSHRLGFRHPDADDGAAIRCLRSENGQRVVVSALSQAMSVLNHPVEDCGDAHEMPNQWARA